MGGAVPTSDSGRPAGRQWLSFVGQILLVTSVEVSDELARGLIAQSDSRLGIVNADRIVSFEAQHDFWLEPGWQLFFRTSHHLLGLPIAWHQTMLFFNFTYALGHISITLLFAIWIFLYRRRLFPFVRNIFFAVNALALVLYEALPVAPPRLVPNLFYDGHPFTFQDTLFALLANGKVIGTQVGFNEFAAMPSIHMAWATIVSLTLICTLRRPLLRLLALCYPGIMLVAVVVTGNHFFMDALGALSILALAIILSFLLEVWREPTHSPFMVFRQLRASARTTTFPAHGSRSSRDEIPMSGNTASTI